MTLLPSAREVASGLLFPEGPVALPNGDVLLCQLAGSDIVQVRQDGSKSVVADLGGSPNGAAVGPDGRLYVVNNGGSEWSFSDGRPVMTSATSADYRGGSIQAVDLSSGAVEVILTETDQRPLSAPNDIVFDGDGGYYFTDIGKRDGFDRKAGWLCYARVGDDRARVVAGPLVTPNGVALASGDSRLYVSETTTGRLWYWDVEGPGRLRPGHTPGHLGKGTLLLTLPGFGQFDSIAVDDQGHICAATLLTGVITVVGPDGVIEDRIRLPEHDPTVTNICFAGPDLRTAYVTASKTGKLFAMEWPWAGMPLHFSDAVPEGV